ncbi:hypothetical protein SPRG_05138, partial [Saprolegnia parasitica CBS 223.65]
MPELAVTWHQVLDILQHAWDETVATLRSVPFDAITGATHDRLVALLEDDRYDANAAIAEGGPAWRDVCSYLADVAAALQQAHMTDDTRTLATTSFCVFVDGSRTARLACDVALQLRRSGRLEICLIDEFPPAPSYSAEFVLNDFTLYCKQNSVPKSKLSVRSQAVRLTQPKALQLIQLQDSADFLVLGAIGAKGPQPSQVGATAMSVVLQSPTSIILVPPIAEAVRIQQAHVFVVAVDVHADAARLCFHSALKLLQPQDTLHVVHVAPLVEPPGTTTEFPLAALYREKLLAAHLQGDVVTLPAERGWTVAEHLQAYVASQRASYLVFGLGDQTKARTSIDNSTVGNVAARLLASPRCTLVICKQSALT